MQSDLAKYYFDPNFLFPFANGHVASFPKNIYILFLPFN